MICIAKWQQQQRQRQQPISSSNNNNNRNAANEIESTRKKAKSDASCLAACCQSQPCPAPLALPLFPAPPPLFPLLNLTLVGASNSCCCFFCIWWNWKRCRKRRRSGMWRQQQLQDRGKCTSIYIYLTIYINHIIYAWAHKSVFKSRHFPQCVSVSFCLPSSPLPLPCYIHVYSYLTLTKFHLYGQMQLTGASVVPNWTQFIDKSTFIAEAKWKWMNTSECNLFQTPSLLSPLFLYLSI